MGSGDEEEDVEGGHGGERYGISTMTSLSLEVGSLVTEKYCKKSQT